MTKPSKTIDHFEPGRGYTEEDWNDVSDHPEWTEEDVKRARPFAEVFPELASNIVKKRGRPPVDQPKRQVTLRLDSAVIDSFKGSGPGWQSRINDALRKAVGLS